MEKKITISQKHSLIKELLATIFINTNNQFIASGLQFKYTSNSIEIEDKKYWSVILTVKESGYGEKQLQEFRFGMDNSVDYKSTEYHVLVEVFTQLAQGALITWLELGKILNTDKELQGTAKETFLNDGN
jgi:hypothetical protein